METVETMRKLATEAASNPKFRAQAKVLIVRLTWLRTVYRYRPEQEEIIRTPERMIEDLNRLGYIEGDCDDISTFLAAIYKAAGWPVRFVMIRFSDPTELQHVFVEVFDGRQWLREDWTVPEGTVHTWLERVEVAV